MKTSAPAHARPLTASGARLRRLAVVGLVAPVVALAACSGESPVTADPTAPAGTTPAATSSSTASTTTAPTTTAAPTSAAPAKYSTRTIKAVIKDPQLGHTITALRVSRNLPFPKNQPVGAEAFEIVGVKVEFAAGSRYSASLDPKMLTLVAARPKQNVAPTAEFGKAYKADPLLTTKRDDRDRGWVFFKVDKGTTSTLRLAFNRPAYAVSTTDKNIPAKTFSVVLTK
ncbi:hypothetical protein [Terrabacter sp. Root181]|uniref:hypothetical protein n=1 Tax=Terrabacter sp. Root181 TaxID=1736484 RepID=UPI0012FB2347|nr:hypothetical protein [Terrabacter sp. Root181]